MGILKRQKAIAFFKNMKDLFNRISAELLELKPFSKGKNPCFQVKKQRNCLLTSLLYVKGKNGIKQRKPLIEFPSLCIFKIMKNDFLKSRKIKILKLKKVNMEKLVNLNYFCNFSFKAFLCFYFFL